MRISRVLCLILTVLPLALPAGAAATPDAPPPQVEVHVSCKSPLDLLQNIDNYVAAATKGTSRSVPPGFVSMMAQFYFPVPFDAWESDAEIHLIILRGETGGTRLLASSVFVFSTSDFTGLVKALEERDWKAGEAIDDSRFESARMFTIPRIPPIVLADLGDNRFALGFSADKIALALEGWTPAHVSPSDIAVNFRMDDGGFLGRMARRRLEREKDDVAAAIAAFGFKPEIAKNAAGALEKYLPRLADELDGVENVVLEIGFAGDDLLFDASARPGADTTLAEIATTLSGAGNVDAALAEILPPGAAAASVGVAAPVYMPDAGERLVRLTADVCGGIMPEFGDKMAGFMDDLFSGGIGQTAVGAYLAGGRQYRLAVTKAGSPDKFIAATAGLAETFNEMWAAALAEPAHGVKFVGDKREADGTVYFVYQTVFANPERFQKLLRRLVDDDGSFASQILAMSRMRVYLAPLADGVLSVTGELSDEEFLACLDKVKNPAGETFAATAPAKKALAGLPISQASVILIDGGRVFDLWAANRMMNIRSIHGEAAAKRFADRIASRANDGNEGTEAVLGLSGGGKDGWLNIRCLIPAEAMGQFMNDFKGFEFDDGAAPVPGRLPGDDAIEDDPEGDGEEEELDEAS